MLKNIFQTAEWENLYEEKAHVLAIYMASENRTKEMEDVIGTKFNALLFKIKDNYFTMFGIKKDWEEVPKYIFSKMMNTKGWIENVFIQIERKAKDLIKFSRSLKKIDYKKKSNTELFSLYEKFVKKFIDMRLYSSTPMNLEHKTQIFTNYLQDELNKIMGKENPEFADVFSTLTTPDKYSYLRIKDIDLMKLATKYDNLLFNKRLTNFSDKYAWIKYTFQGERMNKEQFLEEIKELIIDPDWNKKLKKIEKEKKEISRRQKNIIKKYNINKDLQKYFDYARSIVYYKFFRKGIFAESYYCSEFLLNEIANRLNTTLEVVQGMLFDEVKSALIENKFDEDKIKKRIAYSWLAVYDGKTFEVREDECKNLDDKLFLDKEYEGILEIKGQIAMKGTAEGIVKIVNNKDDLAKMEKGNILVSRLTNPNLLPAMKKASAIVTDMGGLSCHAAIVARELAIPCVVGTSIATKVLKDGDEVVIDANSGMVTIKNKL